MNKYLYLCHPLVLSSPTLMMHGHMNLKQHVLCFLLTYSKIIVSDNLFVASILHVSLLLVLASAAKQMTCAFICDITQHTVPLYTV